MEQGSQSYEIRTDVTACARCGADHCDIEFVQLQRPVGELTHWAACPETGEPILLKSEQAHDRSDSEKSAARIDVRIRSIQADASGPLIVYCSKQTPAQKLQALARDMRELFSDRDIIIVPDNISLARLDEDLMRRHGWGREERSDRPKVPPPAPLSSVYRDRLFGPPVETEQSKIRRARWEGYMQAWRGEFFDPDDIGPPPKKSGSVG